NKCVLRANWFDAKLVLGQTNLPKAYTLLSFFGALALVLAAVGLCGTMSYVVSRRTKELGIRMALGADRRKIHWLVLPEGVWQGAAGGAPRIPMARAAPRLVSSHLFGARGGGPGTPALVGLMWLGGAP